MAQASNASPANTAHAAGSGTALAMMLTSPFV
jgi:hypothetical protein